jgi:hypothetical protein
MVKRRKDMAQMLSLDVDRVSDFRIGDRPRRVK